VEEGREEVGVRGGAGTRFWRLRMLVRAWRQEVGR
jgi:hypothetical protein